MRAAALAVTVGALLSVAAGCGGLLFFGSDEDAPAPSDVDAGVEDAPRFVNDAATETGVSREGGGAEGGGGCAMQGAPCIANAACCDGRCVSGPGGGTCGALGSCARKGEPCGPGAGNDIECCVGLTCLPSNPGSCQAQ